jgi:diguanylate cyclase (GGDEF)-like protein
MQSISLLLVEDSEDDALLLVRELKRGGYDVNFNRVDDKADLRQALDDGYWDLVITDHNLPGFSSDQAVLMIKDSGRDIPVIIVSGSIGEDLAVAAMKMGAHDYIMKSNLTRLVPAIERELREAENRRDSRRAQDTIHHMAYHDALTGLANRHEFENRLHVAIESAAGEGLEHIVIYLDLDQFKIINDTCGHHAGDELLRQLAVLFRDAIRESDCLARLGGDEFGLLLEHCTIERAEHIATNILRLIHDFRYTWDGRTFTVGVSMGLVAIEGDGKSVSDILRSADIACYMAKDKGRSRYHVFRADDKELAMRHGEMEWVSRIHSALEDEQFVLHKQAIVPLAPSAKDVQRFEFLIRLRGADDLIYPGAFMPAAERYNLMPKLDRWVIKSAFAYLANALGPESTVENPHQFFINLSGASLGDKAFFDYIQQQLSFYSLYPGMICFEITETVAISNMLESVDFIKGIRAAGCKIALDDFGSGLSSFSYLKAIPADFLKIDGNFVRDIIDDRMDRAIVESINQIARVAGLQTIAEFVENKPILEELRKIGVDYAQGFGLHKPAPLED